MISVVVPVHEEERTVALLFEELQAALDPLGQPWEAVFVDDGSTDGSFAALTRLHNAHDNVRVVRLRRNFGKAAALAAGFANAQGDVVVTIDADLQDDPAEIPRLLAKLDEGFDLVSGWKAHRRDPMTRRALSRIFNWVTGRVSGLRLHDLNCGLKAYRAEVLQDHPEQQQRQAHDKCRRHVRQAQPHQKRGDGHDLAHQLHILVNGAIFKGSCSPPK